MNTREAVASEPVNGIHYTASYGDAYSLVEDIWIDGDCVGDLHHEDAVYLHAVYHDDLWPKRFTSAADAKAWVELHAAYLRRDG